MSGWRSSSVDEVVLATFAEKGLLPPKEVVMAAFVEKGATSVEGGGAGRLH